MYSLRPFGHWLFWPESFSAAVDPLLPLPLSPKTMRVFFPNGYSTLSPQLLPQRSTSTTHCASPPFTSTKPQQCFPNSSPRAAYAPSANPPPPPSSATPPQSDPSTAPPNPRHRHHLCTPIQRRPSHNEQTRRRLPRRNLRFPARCRVRGRGHVLLRDGGVSGVE